jgi:GNAT superfamily N-acetyltransferase
MSTYVAKLGLWKQDVEAPCANCGSPATEGWSDEPVDTPVAACDVGCWAEYWDGRVKPAGGRKRPRHTEPDMERWSVRVGQISKFKTPWPGLHHVTSPKLDQIEFWTEDKVLAGVLFHMPQFTMDGRRVPGHIAVWVFPAHRGQGIGAKLGCAAARRYGIDLGLQTWSKMGIEMAKKAFRGHPEVSAYRKTDNG